MKKIEKGITRSLPSIKIYKDELAEIYKLIKSELKGDVKILACGYEFDSIKEMDELSEETTNDLTIKFGFYQFNVFLNKFRCEIYSENENSHSEGVVSKIERILLKGKRVMQPWLISRWWPLFALTFIMAVCVILLPMRYFLYSLILCAIVLGIGGLQGFWKLNYYSIVVFKYRKESPSFLKRNKDKILLMIIGALLGSLLTIITTMILEIIKK